jgi:hypothetical protein
VQRVPERVEAFSRSVAAKFSALANNSGDGDGCVMTDLNCVNHQTWTAAADEDIPITVKPHSQQSVEPDAIDPNLCAYFCVY